MASLAAHHKKAEDETFLEFLPFIKSEVHNERKFVKNRSTGRSAI